MEIDPSREKTPVSGGFRPSFWLRSYRGDHGLHNHAFHQFLICLDGHLNLYTRAGDFLLAKDTGVVVGRGHTHEYFVEGTASLLVVDVAEGAWGDLEGALRQAKGVRSLPVSRGLADLLRHSEPSTGRAEISWQPSGRYVDAFRRALGAIVRPCADDRISAAISRLEARHELRPRLDLVAAEAGLSPAHLSRLFNRHLGVPPGRLARARRLEHAARLLVATDCPIAAIAAACGYADQATFTRAFSRRFGLPPGRLRSRAGLRPGGGGMQGSAKTA